MKEDRDRCLAAGMDAFITKPIEAVEFLKVVESCRGRDPVELLRLRRLLRLRLGLHLRDHGLHVAREMWHDADHALQQPSTERGDAFRAPSRSSASRSAIRLGGLFGMGGMPTGWPRKSSDKPSNQPPNWSRLSFSILMMSALDRATFSSAMQRSDETHKSNPASASRFWTPCTS